MLVNNTYFKALVSAVALASAGSIALAQDMPGFRANSADYQSAANEKDHGPPPPPGMYGEAGGPGGPCGFGGPASFGASGRPGGLHGVMGPHHGFPPGPPPELILAGLQLSDEQLQKIASIKNTFELSAASKQAELRALMHDNFLLLTDASIDRDKFNLQQSKINTLEKELGTLRSNRLLDTFQVLTSEQRAKLKHQVLQHAIMPPPPPPPPF